MAKPDKKAYPYTKPSKSLNKQQANKNPAIADGAGGSDEVNPLKSIELAAGSITNAAATAVITTGTSPVWALHVTATTVISGCAVIAARSVIATSPVDNDGTAAVSVDVNPTRIGRLRGGQAEGGGSEGCDEECFDVVHGDC